MRKNGQIIIIEDDEDDAEILFDLITSLNYKNEIKIINDSTLVIDYLKQPNVKPFLIISDINMPKLNGYELRDRIISDPLVDAKCIPYIFCTTAAQPDIVNEGFKRNIQGYFHKTNDYAKYKENVKLLVDYWKTSLLPNEAAYY